MAGMSEERAQRRLTEAEGYLELGLFDEARSRLADVEKASLLPLDCKLLRGNIHREKGEFNEGIPYFREALALEPGNIPATVGLGWCWKRVGQLEAAVEAYQEALRQHPEEGLLHYNLACYLSLLRRPEEALAALDRALESSEEFRALAREESDFDPLRELPAFRERLASPPEILEA